MQTGPGYGQKFVSSEVPSQNYLAQTKEIQ